MPRTPEPRVQPRDVHHVELPEPFAGWWMDVDRDFTMGQLEDMQSGETPRLLAALGAAVVDWNFVSKSGEPLPVGPEGLKQCGQQLLKALLSGVTGTVALPNP